MTERCISDWPSGRTMADLLRGVVRWWHDRDAPLDWDAVEGAWPPGREGAFATQIARVGLINCFQWHLEDECRAQYDAPPALARLKRAIDASNRRRVSAIDEIDRRLAGRLAAGGRPAAAPPAVVTPGALIDQLSILELKRYHADARGRTDTAAADAVRPLAEQIEDYCIAIDELVRELTAGKRQLKFYRTVKLYGAT